MKTFADLPPEIRGRAFEELFRHKSLRYRPHTYSAKEKKLTKRYRRVTIESIGALSVCKQWYEEARHALFLHARVNISTVFRLRDRDLSQRLQKVMLANLHNARFESGRIIGKDLDRILTKMPNLMSVEVEVSYAAIKLDHTQVRKHGPSLFVPNDHGTNLLQNNPLLVTTQDRRRSDEPKIRKFIKQWIAKGRRFPLRVIGAVDCDSVPGGHTWSRYVVRTKWRATIDFGTKVLTLDGYNNKHTITIQLPNLDV